MTQRIPENEAQTIEVTEWVFGPSPADNNGHQFQLGGLTLSVILSTSV